jgi:hypothetical protein
MNIIIDLEKGGGDMWCCSNNSSEKYIDIDNEPSGERTKRTVT